MVNSVDHTSTGYPKATVTASKATDAAALEEVKDSAQEVQEEAAKKPSTDTYESKPATEESGVYKPNDKLVAQLKAEQAQVQARFIDMVKSTLSKQGNNKTFASDDEFWKFMASGNFTVDQETKTAAQDAISENGYWGVKQTSERLVNFAKALVGGDPSRVEEMRAAFEKGFKAATDTWGGALPSITKDTYDATMKLFDEWAKEGKSAETDTAAKAETETEE